MHNIPKLIMDDGRNKMTPVVTIVNTEPWHIGKLKKNLRPEDAAEILRFGVSVQHALWYSYKHSLIRKTAMIDGSVVAIWGCHGTFLGQKGVVWLLTSPEVKKISPLRFCRIYRDEVDEMLKVFPVLSNYVDTSYESAIRLLNNTGFHLYDPEPVGTNGSLFQKFEIKR